MLAKLADRETRLRWDRDDGGSVNSQCIGLSAWVAMSLDKYYVLLFKGGKFGVISCPNVKGYHKVSISA